MHRHWPVIVQCTDCVVFLSKDMRICIRGCFSQLLRFVSRAYERSGKHSEASRKFGEREGSSERVKNVIGAGSEGHKEQEWSGERNP